MSGDLWWMGGRDDDRPATRGPGWRAEGPGRAGGMPSFAPMPSAYDTDELRRRGAQLERLGAESDRLHRAAYHEAAHAYAAWANGLRIDDVSIDHHGAGTTNAGPAALWNARTAAIVLSAGAAGERLRFANAEGTSDDDAVIRDLERVRPADVSGASRRAEAIVRFGEAAISELASALIKRRRLTGREVVEILSQHACAECGLPPDRVPSATVRSVAPEPAVRDSAGRLWESRDYPFVVTTRNGPGSNTDNMPADSQHMGPNESYIGATVAPDSTDPHQVDVDDLLADLAELVDSADSGTIIGKADVIQALQSALAALQTAKFGTIAG